METEVENTHTETVRHLETSLGYDKDETNQDHTDDGEKTDAKFEGHQACQIQVLAGVKNRENVCRDIHERSRDSGADDDGSRYQVRTDIILTSIAVHAQGGGESAVKESKI